MTDTDEYIKGLLEHAGASKEEIAAYNRAYYLKNRKLKGRPKAGDVPQPKRTAKVPSRPDRGGDMKRVVVKSAAQKRAEDRYRLKKNQEKIAAVRKKAAKLPPKKRNFIEKKLDAIERKYKNHKNSIDKITVTTAKKPNWGLKVEKTKAPPAPPKKKQQRIKDAEKRIERARAAAKNLPSSSRNAIEKKIDAVERKYKNHKNSIDKITVTTAKKPNWGLKVEKTKAKSNTTSKKTNKTDSKQRAIEAEKRLAAARKAAKKLPPKKRNAIEKKLDSAEKKLKGLKGKLGNPFNNGKTVDRSGPVREIRNPKAPSAQLINRVNKDRARIEAAKKAARKAPPAKQKSLLKRLDDLSAKLARASNVRDYKLTKSEKKLINKIYNKVLPAPVYKPTPGEVRKKDIADRDARQVVSQYARKSVERKQRKEQNKFGPFR